MNGSEFGCKGDRRVLSSGRPLRPRAFGWSSVLPVSWRTIVGVGLVLACQGLSACAPLVIGGAAAAGSAGMAATEQRGIGGFVDDAGIQIAINDLWFKHSPSMHSRLDMTIDQGRVLLTGRAENVQERLDAVRLAWQAKGVKEVINEIQVGPSTGLVDSAKDSWITTQLRSAVTFDKNISQQNYSITTVDRVVYLLGTAKSQDELDRVLEHARGMPSVQRVVSHVNVIH